MSISEIDFASSSQGNAPAFPPGPQTYNFTWAAFFNQRSEDDMPSDDELDPALYVAADAVKTWPGAIPFRGCEESG